MFDLAMMKPSQRDSNLVVLCAQFGHDEDELESLGVGRDVSTSTLRRRVEKSSTQPW